MEHTVRYFAHCLLDTGLPCPKYMVLLPSLLIFPALSNISLLSWNSIDTVG